MASSPARPSPNGELSLSRGPGFLEGVSPERDPWPKVPTRPPRGTRVLIADDHPVVRAGLAAVIAQEPDLELVGEAENGERAVALFREHQPDVVLMDLRMPVMGGVEAIRAITREFPDARILALTTYEGDADIRRALGAGARGYLLKDMLLSDVITAIRTVLRGDG